MSYREYDELTETEKEVVYKEMKPYKISSYKEYIYLIKRGIMIDLKKKFPSKHHVFKTVKILKKKKDK